MRLSTLAALALLAACGTPASGPDGGSDVDGGEPPALDLNDVSFLYPLPSASGDEGRLLALSSSGARGELLPLALLRQVPAIVSGQTPEQLRASVRVVSARVDPCFPASAPPVTGCIVQVRLVAQPLALGATGWTADDATLHLFYTLDSTELPALKARIAALRQQAGTATQQKPLDVHPVMKSEGLAGAYARAVNQLVLDFCGDQNLTRVAFMSVFSGGDRWAFGAFNRSADTLVADAIPLVSTTTVQGFNEFGTAEVPRGEMAPWPRNDKLFTLVNQSELDAADDRTLSTALAAALNLENPANSSPKTADCVYCHVASRALHHALVGKGLNAAAFAESFSDPGFDLRRVDGAKDDPHALRSFGYFGQLSALSQRTINESARVARALAAP